MLKPSKVQLAILTRLVTRNWTLYKAIGSLERYCDECERPLPRAKPYDMVASLHRDTPYNFGVRESTVAALLKRGWIEREQYPTTFTISRAGCAAIGAEYVEYWWMTDPEQRKRLFDEFGPDNTGKES